MPWPTYSERFLAVYGAAGYTTYYVPAGHRAVLKAVTANNPGGNAGTVQLTIAGKVAYWHRFPASVQFESFSTTLVVYGGEDLTVYTEFTTLSVFASGFLFADATGRSGPPGGAQQLPSLPTPPVVPPS
jgi:hypothetical protein